MKIEIFTFQYFLLFSQQHLDARSNLTAKCQNKIKVAFRLTAHSTAHMFNKFDVVFTYIVFPVCLAGRFGLPTNEAHNFQLYWWSHNICTWLGDHLFTLQTDLLQKMKPQRKTQKKNVDSSLSIFEGTFQNHFQNLI